MVRLAFLFVFTTGRLFLPVHARSISFLLNNKYVFNENEEKRNILKAILKVYTSYSITGLFLTGILLYIEEEILGIYHYIATLLNLLITIPINFILNKFWAYNDKNKGG